MRLRSEWLTLFTLTALCAGGIVHASRGGAPAAPGGRLELAAAGVDRTPTGSLRPNDRARGPKPLRP